MGRLAASNLTEVQAASLRPVILVRLDFPSGELFLTDVRAPGLTYGGDTYTCDGTLQGISPISERADGKVANCEVLLSYANATVLAAARDDKFHYSEAEIAFGFLSAATNTFVTTPDSLGNWYMSSAEIDTGGTLVRLTLEPTIIDLRQASLITSSDADQQKRYSGDTFFKHTAALDEKQIQWGGDHLVVRTRGGGGAAGGGTVQLPNGPVWDLGITP